MELRSTHWIGAIRLAVVVSAIATAVAVALTAFGNVSQTALVVGVIVVGFVVSWIHSGRDAYDSDGPDGSDGWTERSPSGAGMIGRDGHVGNRVSAVRVHHPAR